MHPNRKFHIASQEEMAAIVRRIGFGALVAQTEAGLRAVHVPVLLQGERLRFHISKGNAVHAALAAGCEALFVVNGEDSYVSPEWYGLDDRVPTWSYVAVELNGPVRPLGPEALVRLLDDMSAEQEEKLAPKTPWTRDKMSEGRFEGLLKAITGFEMEVRDWRGTAKLDQDKPAEVRNRLAAAMAERGAHDIAALYSSPTEEAGAGTPPRGQEFEQRST
jgi:transcriptional regulator